MFNRLTGMNAWRAQVARKMAVGAALIVLVGCGAHGPAKEEGEPEEVRPVKGVAVRMEERAVFEELVGSVRTRMRAVVEAKVSGRLESMPVGLGQKVAAGEVVAEIDAREVRARLEQATAQRDQAAQDLERVTSLVRKQAVSRQDFDAAQARFRVADATVREAETMLGYARVTAPFDGVVARRLAEVGDLAVPGRPLLEIEDRGALRFEIDVPEAVIDGLEIGQGIAVTVPALNRTFDAEIVEIAPTAEASSRTFLAKLDLPDSAGLRAGQFGRAAVPVGRAESLRVPRNALLLRGQMEMVFVVADGRARLRLVKSGKTIGDSVEILSGLAPGETVVADDVARLIDGVRVEVRE